MGDLTHLRWQPSLQWSKEIVHHLVWIATLLGVAAIVAYPAVRAFVWRDGICATSRNAAEVFRRLPRVNAHGVPSSLRWLAAVLLVVVWSALAWILVDCEVTSFVGSLCSSFVGLRERPEFIELMCYRYGGAMFACLAIAWILTGLAGRLVQMDSNAWRVLVTTAAIIAALAAVMLAILLMSAITAPKSPGPTAHSFGMPSIFFFVAYAMCLIPTFTFAATIVVCLWGWRRLFELRRFTPRETMQIVLLLGLLGSAVVLLYDGPVIQLLAPWTLGL